MSVSQLLPHTCVCSCIFRLTATLLSTTLIEKGDLSCFPPVVQDDLGADKLRMTDFDGPASTEYGAPYPFATNISDTTGSQACSLVAMFAI